MSQLRHFFLASALLSLLVLAGVPLTALGQAASPADTKLALRAALVLTPEFCATKKKKGDFASGKETFEIGKTACAELEPALRAIFSSLTRLEAVPSSGDAQVVLLPRFVDIGEHKEIKVTSANREMVVLLEWTVKEKSGQTVWIETVEGSAKRSMGNGFTRGKNIKRITDDSVKDLAQQSANKMSTTPENDSSEILTHVRDVNRRRPDRAKPCRSRRFGPYG